MSCSSLLEANSSRPFLGPQTLSVFFLVRVEKLMDSLLTQPTAQHGQARYGVRRSSVRCSSKTHSKWTEKVWRSEKCARRIFFGGIRGSPGNSRRKIQIQKLKIPDLFDLAIWSTLVKL